MGNCIHKTDDNSLHDHNMDASVYDTQGHTETKHSSEPMVKTEPMVKREPMVKHLTSKTTMI